MTTWLLNPKAHATADKSLLSAIVLMWSLSSSMVLAAVASPDFPEVKATHPSAYAELNDRHGLVLARRRVDMDENRLDWTALADMSPALVEAVIFAEDRDFYRHHGIDWGATSRALVNLLHGDKSRGASTITMQLVGLLHPELAWRKGGRSISSKWQQMQAARALEAHWTKAEILEAYLNLNQFRGDLSGIAAASNALFNKQPSGLDRDESLLLAALLPSPTAPAATVARHACTLIQAGFSHSSCERTRFLATTRLDQRRIPFNEQPELAAIAWRYLSTEQRHVTTTLDGKLQAYALERLQAQLASLRDREVNAGAVLVLDNASGEVLAYVANAGLVEQGRFVDAIMAQRQAGSTLKPFLYQLALEKQLLTAASLIQDEAIRLPTPQGMYIPQNYEKDFKGIVTVRTALASSLNVPAVRTQLLVGVDDFWQRLRALGFDSLTEMPDFYGYGLALGDADVSLWMEANAYRTLANGGLSSTAHLLPTALPATPVAIMDPQTSFIVADILSDRQARALTFGLENPLATPFWTAVKTGTSKDMRDNWCLGFSQRYTVAVWVGNLNGAPMRDVSGITGAAPVWSELMAYLEGQQWHTSTPQPPSGLIHQTVSFTGVQEHTRQEWFVANTELATVSYTPDDKTQILSPSNETIFALDPDIPAQQQLVRFRSNATSVSLFWWLNQHNLGSAKELRWAPVSGKYRLALRDAHGQEQDAVVFEVRGRQAKSHH